MADNLKMKFHHILHPKFPQKYRMIHKVVRYVLLHSLINFQGFQADKALAVAHSKLRYHYRHLNSNIHFIKKFCFPNILNLHQDSINILEFFLY